MSYLAFRLALEFPRLDSQISIGDGTPQFGDCLGHPPGTHKGYKTGRTAFDINYFTTVAYDPENGLYGNDTQYTPGEVDNDYAIMTNIWTNLDRKNMILNEKMFDWEKTFYYLKYILELFPRFHCSIHEKIWECIQRNTDIKEWQPIRKHVSEDYGHHSYHHTHIHCDVESINH